MSTTLTLFMMALLLLLKGFFSGAEIAFVSADRVKLRYRAAQGHAGAKLAQRLLADPARLLATTLFGTNLATVALATVGTLLMVEIFKDQGELIAVLLFTPLFLILGEIVPKSIYQQKANDIVPVAAYPLAFLQTALAPVIWVFARVAKLAASLIGGSSDGTSATRDQFHAAVRTAEKSAVAAAFSRGQVRNVLRFAQLSAEEAMLPMADVERFPRDARMGDLVTRRLATGERLIPIYDTSPAHITGIVRLESWDLLDPGIANRPTEDYCGPLKSVPRTMPVSEIIETLHANPDLTILVVDDANAGLGIITLTLLVRSTLGAEVEATRGHGRM